MKIVLKERLKTHKGITLIALVITIIVLLILAGVAIATLTGDNGIIAKAQQAKMQNDKANEKEQIDLAVLASKINNDASIDKKTLRKELDGISNLIESGIPTSDEYSFPLILVGKTGTEYEIDEDANVSEKIDYSEVVVPTITATGNLAAFRHRRRWMYKCMRSRRLMQLCRGCLSASRIRWIRERAVLYIWRLHRRRSNWHRCMLDLIACWRRHSAIQHRGST